MGPYEERDKWRIVVVENGKRKSVFLDTEAEALRAKSELERKVLRPVSKKLCDVITLWEQELLRTGTTSAISVTHKAFWARTLLKSMLEEEISSVTPRQAAAMYEKMLSRESRMTGRPLAAATQRFALWTARNFFAWASAVGCVGSNPFKDVKPVGKVNAGKSQLRIEEARRFARTALDLFEKTEHPLAIGALVALMMGLRTQEVLLREVRDLDDGGRFLWIDAGKTANAKRHLEVPELLRPYLLRLAAGQSPSSLLFGYGRTGMPRTRTTMWATVRKLCALAGVPPVCTHSLRGLYATLAVQSGSASHVVASSLGHGSFQITQRHYAQASSVANASTARVQSILDSPLQDEEKALALAADLSAHLERPVLLRLAQLLAQS
jgi:integrase